MDEAGEIFRDFSRTAIALLILASIWRFCFRDLPVPGNQKLSALRQPFMPLGEAFDAARGEARAAEWELPVSVKTSPWR